MVSSCATPVGTRVSGCGPLLFAFTALCLLTCFDVAGRARQLDRERGAAAQRAFHLDGAVQRADDLPEHPEPESEAGRGSHRRRPLETIEDPAMILGRDANSMVAHAEPRQIGGRLDGDGDRFTGTILHRVTDEVRDDLLEPEPVPASDDGSWRGERRRTLRPC